MSDTSPIQSQAILEQLGRLLRELTRTVGGADDGPAMTATQRIALIEVDEGGPLRLNDLATRMGTSAPTASRAADVLEGLGLVVRTPDSADRRALSIELTRQGRALVDDRKARAAAAFEPAVAALSAKDRASLLDVLARLTRELQR
jgi:DNA-binding MarR family transcriptional regulator